MATRKSTVKKVVELDWLGRPVRANSRARKAGLSPRSRPNKQKSTKGRKK